MNYMLYTKQEVLEMIKLGYSNTMLSCTYTRKEPDAEGNPVEEARYVPLQFFSLLFNESMSNDINELEKFCMEAEEDVRIELKLFLDRIELKLSLDKDIADPSDTITVECVLPVEQKEALKKFNINDLFKRSVRCMLKEVINALIERGNKK